MSCPSIPRTGPTHGNESLFSNSQMILETIDFQSLSGSRPGLLSLSTLFQATRRLSSCSGTTMSKTREPGPWKAKYLQPYYLLCFAALLAVTCVICEALLAVSIKNHGLALSSPGSHFLWTYLPMTLMTIAATAWGPVVFESQLTAPWSRMSKGPAPAECTMLLEYSSMSVPVLLTKAI